MSSRSTRAGGAFALLSALLVCCALDDRTLQPLPVFWIPDAGQGGDGEAGNPFEGGTSGGGKGGGTASTAGGGQGSTGGSPAGGGAGLWSAGSAGTTGGLGNEGGAPTQPAPGCEDLDSDGVPDCDETLVKNGSFDTDLAGWIADETTIEQSWAQQDSNDQVESGSLSINNVTMEDVDGYTVSGTEQCVGISETGSYHFVSELFIAEGQGEGNGGVNLWFWNLPNCQGAIIDSAVQFAGNVGVWQFVYANPVTPMGARSVSVRLVAAKPFRNPLFKASFDNILFVQD